MRSSNGMIDHRRKSLVGFMILMASALVLATPAGASSWHQDLLAHGGASPSLMLSHADLDAAIAPLMAPQISQPGPGKSESAPRRGWNLLLSALVPGMGELSGGYGRGGFMMLTDAFMWAKIYTNDNQGNAWEGRYKAFADEHYSEEEWIRALREGALEDYFEQYGPFSSPDDVALYVTREDDEREWYENIGKWDVFTWGWEEYWDEPDWPISDENPFWDGNPEHPAYNSPLRDEYVKMRGWSNDAFERRDSYKSATILFRLFSVLQVAYLEGFIGKRYNQGNDSNRAGSNSGTEADRLELSWFFRSADLQSAWAGLKVSY